MTVRIERLGPGDGERWRCIRLRALAEAPYAFSTTHAMAAQWSADRWETQVVELATFVAVVDGSDVGVARGATPGNREVRELLSLWVAPIARRQGIGARLIESVAAWASASGATELALDVAWANAPVIALYERAGFVRFEGGATGERALDEVRLVRSLATSS